MFTHASSHGANVTAYLDDGRSCTWAVFTEAQAVELARLINAGLFPGWDFRPRPPIRLVPRHDLQPPAPADDWLRLRASSMAKEAAAIASGEQPDTGRREPAEKKPGVLDRAIRWLAGA